MYLDGLSKGIHGDEARQRADAVIRDQVEDAGWNVVAIAASHLDDPVVLAADFRGIARALQRRDLADAVATDTSWYEAPVPDTTDGAAPTRLLDRIAAEPYVRHLPVYSIRAAAGRFLENEEAIEEGWVAAPGSLREGMFAIRVVGRSMEPTIPDGSLAVFVADPAGGPLPGSREGKIVLAALREATDPEGGGSYTVKRYHSEKAANDDGGWGPTRIELQSLNREIADIAVEPGMEVDVIAEFVGVLGDGSTSSDHNGTLRSAS